MDERLQVAIPIFDRLTALDAVGPYEVLQRIPHADVIFCATEPGEMRTENGMLGIVADQPLSAVPWPDVIVVPGGIGCREALADEVLLDWLRAAHATSRWTTSVCTGSLVLAAAGLLDGLAATTHWGAVETLRSLGAQPVTERVVVHPDERIMTAAGVSSGIDMALTLVAELVDPVAAQAAQLMVEYDPQPPFDAGSTEKASAEVRDRAAAYAARRD